MRLVVDLTGIEQMAKGNEAFLADLETEVFEALREQAVETRTEARAGAPVFTGELRKQIRMRSSRARMTSTVKSFAHHSWLVKHGRTPGKMPSVDPAHAKNPKSAQRLADFAKAHGIAPFVLARAIGRKGTRAHPFFLFGHTQEVFSARIAAAVERVKAKFR